MRFFVAAEQAFDAVIRRGKLLLFGVCPPGEKAAYEAFKIYNQEITILGSMAVQGSVIDWVADHRKHHAFTDEEGDPHSPHLAHGGGLLGNLKGLYHAHVGWLFDEHGMADAKRFAPDLLDDDGMRFINRHFIWIVLLGLVILAVLSATAIVGPVFMPFDFGDVPQPDVYVNAGRPPSAEHFFGETGGLQRDVFVLVVNGAHPPQTEPSDRLIVLPERITSAPAERSVTADRKAMSSPRWPGSCGEAAHPPERSRLSRLPGAEAGPDQPHRGFPRRRGP